MRAVWLVMPAPRMSVEADRFVESRESLNSTLVLLAQLDPFVASEFEDDECCCFVRWGLPSCCV